MSVLFVSVTVEDKDVDHVRDLMAYPLADGKTYYPSGSVVPRHCSPRYSFVQTYSGQYLMHWPDTVIKLVEYGYNVHIHHA